MTADMAADLADARAGIDTAHDIDAYELGKHAGGYDRAHGEPHIRAEIPTVWDRYGPDYRAGYDRGYQPPAPPTSCPDDGQEPF